MGLALNTNTGTFVGRTALITGAAGDIGSTTALRLASAGAQVILADRVEAVEEIAEIAERCKAVNANADPVTTIFDVTSESEVSRAFDQLAADGHVADLLFNNAGYQGDFANVADYDPSDFRAVLDVNVVGVFLVLQKFTNLLIASGRPGAIVNAASMAHTGAPNMAAYSASKAAVIALTKTAGRDLAPKSIRVNSVSPAFIGPCAMWDRQVKFQAATPSQYYSDEPDQVINEMIGAIPLRRRGSLDEVASVVHFLLSDDASYLTAVDIEVSGGI